MRGIAARAPLNASPAPVASRRSTVNAGAGTRKGTPCRTGDEHWPRPPRVTTTAVPAAEQPRGVRPRGRGRRPPASTASSPRFGVTMSASATTLRARPVAGAGLRIVVAPAARAARSAADDRGRGSSHPTRTTSSAPRPADLRAPSTTSPRPARSHRQRRRCCSRRRDRRGSGRRRSDPGGSSARRGRSPRRRARRARPRPDRRPPTAPTNATRAPRRAAAVAWLPPFPP